MSYARQMLQGRILVHTRAPDAEPVLSLIGARPSGIVLTGTRGARTAARLRQVMRLDCPLLLDPAAYETEVATPEQPFWLGEGDRQFVKPTLGSFLSDLLAAGADAVLTPTKYIRRGEIEALEAVLDTSADLPPEAVLAIPLDVDWIAPERVGKLAGLLNRSPAPKAVMLGGQFNPPERVANGLPGLRRLAGEVADIALFRTDLAAFDGLAHGALSGAIGTSSTLRHIIPPGERPFTSNHPDAEPDNSPHLLVRDLVHYVKGSALADGFGDKAGPLCGCRHCRQRRLTSFLARGDWRDARLHGVAVWTDWLPDLVDQPSLTDRQRYWSSLCRLGIDGHAIYNRMAANPDSPFAPDRPLLFWAGAGPAGQAVKPRAGR
jgi:hypothetical protein